MRFLVTGGAGFIGRWVVKRLLEDGHGVWVLDNLSNGSRSNLDEFSRNSYFHGLSTGDVSEYSSIREIFNHKFDFCIHAAAQINVQESLDNPERSFKDNVTGTFNVMQNAREHGTRVVLIGTCMVYDTATVNGKLSETSPVKSSSPYAASKLAAEYLAHSYYFSYGLPVTLLRPFNTYGPFQKTNMEGGVVSIFVNNFLKGEKLQIFGDGTQTRDLLYVEDCADFIVRAAYSEKAIGQVINAGTGRDITVNELARLICPYRERIEHVKHHHPQSEIPKLQCDNTKAKELIGWEPTIGLIEGIQKTKDWISSRGLN